MISFVLLVVAVFCVMLGFVACGLVLVGWVGGCRVDCGFCGEVCLVLVLSRFFFVKCCGSSLWWWFGGVSFAAAVVGGCGVAFQIFLWVVVV